MINVAIVGGGLSGLVIAHELNEHHPDVTWNLYEANSTLGGRLKNDPDGQEIDLGGAWVWPSFQPLMEDLLDSLNLKTFQQPDDYSRVRVVGGAAKIISTLHDSITRKSSSLEREEKTNEHHHRHYHSNNIYCNTPIVSCRKTSSSSIILVTKDGTEVECERVVFAIPPKILATKVEFDPPLDSRKQSAMNKSQTWMAGVTKVSLLYETKFWSGHGRRGASNVSLFPKYGSPGFMVYDASPHDTTTTTASGSKKYAALTVFAIASLCQKDNDDAVLAEKCAEQLSNTWSSRGMPTSMQTEVLNYKSFHVKRWPMDPYISNDTNPRTINPHPYPMHHLASNDWDDTLLFAGTESDLSEPGVMEGAVGSSKRVMDNLEEFYGKAHH